MTGNQVEYAPALAVSIIASTFSGGVPNARGEPLATTKVPQAAAKAASASRMAWTMAREELPPWEATGSGPLGSTRYARPVLWNTPRLE